jgi:hypothetical protein
MDSTRVSISRIQIRSFSSVVQCRRQQVPQERPHDLPVGRPITKPADLVVERLVDDGVERRSAGGREEQRGDESGAREDRGGQVEDHYGPE